MEVTHGAIQCTISESGITEAITTGESVCLVLSQGIQPIGSYDLRVESEDETGYLRGRSGGGGEQEPPVGGEAHPVAGIRKDSGGTEGEWLRGNGLHTEHLAVWEQEVREAMRKGVIELREELKAAKKKIKEQERELARKEKALAKRAIV